MGASRGIAGSSRPEVAGIFLCSDKNVDWFISMNNTGGPVDVWAVDGVEVQALVESPEGYWYLPAPIPPERLTLVQSMVMPPPRELISSPSVYSSTLTITFDDGTVLRDEGALDRLRRLGADADLHDGRGQSR